MKQHKNTHVRSPHQIAQALSKVALEAYFSLPKYQACSALGIDEETLRCRCRELGIKRWPYRQNHKDTNQIVVTSTNETCIAASACFSSFFVANKSVDKHRNIKKDLPCFTFIEEHIPTVHTEYAHNPITFELRQESCEELIGIGLSRIGEESKAPFCDDLPLNLRLNILVDPMSGQIM